MEKDLEYIYDLLFDIKSESQLNYELESKLKRINDILDILYDYKNIDLVNSSNLKHLDDTRKNISRILE